MEIEGKLGSVILARLEPHADLLESILEIAKRHKMKAGVILSITGSLDRAVFQRFQPGRDSTQVIGVEEMEGPIESSGHGIIGIVDAPDRGDVPFGVGKYTHGDSYAHVHLTVTNATETVCGHVMPGCIVRSNHAVSHFTIMIAPIEEAALKLRIDGTPEAGSRGVYHLLETVSA
ncbi:PPC domain-containing DNA-binding protein [Rhodococcus sp. NPDC057529]|uniref:PPC domain-containing DNA-binding protein n=1 Tax=Rhodococcus sp. NPDC057529 TaxID=3346158 RepID=UPI00366D9176